MSTQPASDKPSRIILCVDDNPFGIAIRKLLHGVRGFQGFSRVFVTKGRFALSQRKKVLIVDCDADYLIALERYLEEGGFDTTSTWDACEAEALLGSRQFNAVLVGEHPPEVKSEEILKGLRTRRSLPCIVLQAAMRHPFDAQHLSSLGAYAVVPKQKIKEVMQKVHESLKNSHAASAGAA